MEIGVDKDDIRLLICEFQHDIIRWRSYQNTGSVTTLCPSKESASSTGWQHRARIRRQGQSVVTMSLQGSEPRRVTRWCSGEHCRMYKNSVTLCNMSETGIRSMEQRTPDGTTTDRSWRTCDGWHHHEFEISKEHLSTSKPLHVTEWQHKRAIIRQEPDTPSHRRGLNPLTKHQSNACL